MLLLRFRSVLPGVCSGGSRGCGVPKGVCTAARFGGGSVRRRFVRPDKEGEGWRFLEGVVGAGVVTGGGAKKGVEVVVLLGLYVAGRMRLEVEGGGAGVEKGSVWRFLSGVPGTEGEARVRARWIFVRTT